MSPLRAQINETTTTARTQSTRNAIWKRAKPSSSTRGGCRIGTQNIEMTNICENWQDKDILSDPPSELKQNLKWNLSCIAERTRHILGKKKIATARLETVKHKVETLTKDLDTHSNTQELDDNIIKASQEKETSMKEKLGSMRKTIAAWRNELNKIKSKLGRSGKTIFRTKKGKSQCRSRGNKGWKTDCMAKDETGATNPEQ